VARRVAPMQVLAVIAIAAVMVALPALVRNQYYVGIAVFVGINVIVAIGLNLLMGYAGQISLGHAAFMAIGAYTCAILTTRSPISPWWAMAAGVVLAAVVAAAIGVPTLKLHGHYLAMATLGFGMIVSIVIVEWVGLTGGPSGLVDLPRLKIAGAVLDTDTKYYYLVWAMVAGAFAISFNLVNSRVGRALRAVHTSEVAAATCGINIARAKLQVFVLSAALAGLAGGLYAYYVQFVGPGHTFGFGFSIELVLMVVFGGLATIWGALVGASVFTVLGEGLRAVGDYDVVAFGVVLLLVLVLLPRGMVRLGAARIAGVLAAAALLTVALQYAGYLGRYDLAATSVLLLAVLLVLAQGLLRLGTLRIRVATGAAALIASAASYAALHLEQALAAGGSGEGRFDVVTRGVVWFVLLVFWVALAQRVAGSLGKRGGTA